jgi:hypothetical protein
MTSLPGAGESFIPLNMHAKSVELSFLEVQRQGDPSGGAMRWVRIYSICALAVFSASDLSLVKSFHFLSGE